MARLKVLALATRLPVPPWRGDQIRAYHHLRVLAGRHDVTLCALVLGRVDAAHAAGVRALGVRLEVVPLGVAAAPLALARAVVEATPLQVLLFRRGGAVARVRRLLARERFDVVHAQLVRTGCYWPGPGGPPVVFDVVDALSANFARRAARERGVVAWGAGREAARLRDYERALVRRAAVTVVVAEPDRAALGDGAVRVVPNGVDHDAFAFADRSAAVPGRIVFAGNLGYFPNVDAARWLVDDILPVVRRSIATATVHLVGARPSAAIRALASRPAVSLVADAPAMAPEIASGAITIIPMRSGSGMQNKVLEAMAVGTPVVTTPLAAAALAVHPGEHLLVGETTEELAAAAVGLLTDGTRAARMARAARTLVVERYGWEASAAAVESAWRDAHATTNGASR